MRVNRADPLEAEPARRDYLIEATLMALALVPVLVSLYVSYATGEGHWFQRSGCLMVLFSVGVEVHRRGMRRTAGGGSPQAAGATVAIARLWRSIPYVCYLAIFMGTLIWGYGDLLFR